MVVKALAMLLGSVLLVGVVLAGTRPAYAETFECTTSLDGSQEVPAVETDGTGTATLTFDSETRELGWEIEFSDLSGNATAAHFHGAAASGSNAGVQVDIGDISGLDSPMNGTAVLSAVQATALLDGEIYINIHTEENPDGEIRGQVSCEPGSPPVEEEWQTAALTYGDEEHEIQYIMTNGTLNELAGDADAQMITAEITAEQDGELQIQLPREMIDSVAGEQDLDYIVFVDEIQEYAEDDFGEEVRTLTIPFVNGSRLIDIVSASPPAVEPGLPETIQTLSVAGANIDVTVKSSSNITAFSLDEETKTLSFAVEGEEGTEGVTEITIGRILEGPYAVAVDGDVTTDFEIDEASGETVIRLSYVHGIDEVTITGTNVVPEFPVAAVALAASIVGIIAVTARYGKFSFLPRM
jgi:predicted secreted protein with PEFG-CTERM motif